MISRVVLLVCLSAFTSVSVGQERDGVLSAMKRAASHYVGEVSSHGGYVYYYSTDLSERWGEGKATVDQIWVQNPGTPAVGRAFLEAYAATTDSFYLDAATRAAEALIYGQLESGAWTNSVDFDPKGERVSQYRNGKGKGRNFSTLDDGISQGALVFMMRLDEAGGFKNKALGDSIRVGLDALLSAQFSNGAFPQGWDGPVENERESIPASFPDYDWRTEGRIKEYWDQYTLNDNVMGTVAEVLMEAERIYKDDRYRAALVKLGDFLLLAQMPEPQRGWAQQYDSKMRPIWARAFEPPAVAGDETQEVIETLMAIAKHLKDARYLQPIPSALAFLKKSILPDGRLARFYELETNKPLYMTRSGKAYSLTHDDSDLPDHYGWKIGNRIAELEALHQRIMSRQAEPPPPVVTVAEVTEMIGKLDDRGRWLSTYDGGLIVGQPNWKPGYVHLSSAVFSDNLTRLSRYVRIQ